MNEYYTDEEYQYALKQMVEWWKETESLRKQR